MTCFIYILALHCINIANVCKQAKLTYSCQAKGVIISQIFWLFCLVCSTNKNLAYQFCYYTNVSENTAV